MRVIAAVFEFLHQVRQRTPAFPLVRFHCGVEIGERGVWSCQGFRSLAAILPPGGDPAAFAVGLPIAAGWHLVGVNVFWVWGFSGHSDSAYLR